MIEPGDRIVDRLDRGASGAGGRRSMMTSRPSARAAAILP